VAGAKEESSVKRGGGVTEWGAEGVGDSGGHTGGACGAVHQGPRALGGPLAAKREFFFR
jgi:hypothetical protein